MAIFDNTFVNNASTPFTLTAPLQPSTNASLPVVSGYTFYTGSFDTPASTAGHPTLDLVFNFTGSAALTMDFVRPTGPKDFFAPDTVNAVTTTSVSAVPTVVTAISSASVPISSVTNTGAVPTGTASGKTSGGSGGGPRLGGWAAAGMLAVGSALWI